MLKLVGFFLATLVVLVVLREIPVLGRVFEVPILGFWGAAILVALVASRFASAGVARAGVKRKLRELQGVDTPHNLGKRGALLLASGRLRAALEPLRAAVRGEPESLEWRYRLGLAELATGSASAAVEALSEVARRDEEYAYGAVQLALARALEREHRFDDAHDALLVFERNHGASPESACRRGLLLKRLGRRDEARVVLAGVPALTRRAAGKQKEGAAGWYWRALFARWV